ncbi:MAG: acyltransferase [Brevinema sp.]
MKIGKHSTIASTTVIKNSERLIIGDHCSILDFSIISPKITMGNFCLIDRFVLIAGSRFNFTMEDFSGIGGGAKIWLQSNDYVNSLISHEAQITGDIIMKKYSGIGSNTVVMPNNIIPEGTVIGANSFVPTNFPFEPWSVYVGSPICKIKDRNKIAILKEAEELIKNHY